MDISRYKIEVKGTVQGIGFRPFVFKEALKKSLTGHVYNHSSGVTIEAEGILNHIKDFIEVLKTHHPPFANIHEVMHKEINVKNDTEFKILNSISSGKSETLISPDIATCSECLRDIGDTSNRRYNYPFTNCTNCGPRYTIIESVPYDRPLTSMKSFEMCTYCKTEYKDPLNRRYHAQPNCCPECGPSLYPIDIDETVKKLAQGYIVAIKGLGGFHLACDATNDETILKLRKRKRRDEKPFAVMMKDSETIRKYCEMSEMEEKILTSPQRPIVLLKKKSSESILSKNIAPGNSCLGVMLPYTPLHYILFSSSPSHRSTLPRVEEKALVMTSANISDEPICFDNEEAIERLKDIADYFLLHNRNIYIRTDDSIARVINNKPLLIRRARGYVPQPILLTLRQAPGERKQNESSDILAVGAELKNTVCLLKGNKAIISQHIGDLENNSSNESFKKTIDHLQKLFDVEPRVIAHDIHPDYFSTRWATSAVSTGPVPAGCPRTTTLPAGQPTLSEPISVELIGVQHHHAHVASCMAENHIDGPVIGIALDGTGYGTDGNIWGGEILVADYKDFKRAAQFEYVQMPGGEAAIKNPWMMALAYLAKIQIPKLKILSKSKGRNSKLKFLEGISDEKIDLVKKMLEKNINSPQTSSCGRLFDVVAAILGIRQSVSYEGQAAMELEMHAVAHEDQSSKTKVQRESKDQKYSYKYEIITDNDYFTISYKRTLNDILNDLQNDISVNEIALKFHNTVVAALTDTTLKISSIHGINRVCLSGGCFQNAILSENLKNSLESLSLKVYTHSLVPPNDGGISLGQATIALNRTPLPGEDVSEVELSF